MERMSISSQSLTGHYGDPISLIRLMLLDGKTSEKVVRSILERLSPSEREEVWGERSEKGKHGGKLYLRLDKQAAFLGAVRLSDKDPVKVQVNVRGKLEALRRRLEGE